MQDCYLRLAFQNDDWRPATMQPSAGWPARCPPMKPLLKALLCRIHSETQCRVSRAVSCVESAHASPWSMTMSSVWTWPTCSMSLYPMRPSRPRAGAMFSFSSSMNSLFSQKSPGSST